MGIDYCDNNNPKEVGEGGGGLVVATSRCVENYIFT